MAGRPTAGSEVVPETDRLLLRPWRVAEAAVQRELWAERDSRVPPHRRIDADGHPTIEELEERIRTSPGGLLAAERKDTRDVIGYCGLIDSGVEGEPELAFEFLRRAWGQGYATEAASAVVDWARRSGYQRLWATVREWNTASRRVLHKAGFTETDQVEPSEAYGNTLFTTIALTQVSVRVVVPADLLELNTAIPTGRNDVHAAFLRRQEAGEVAYLAAWLDGVPVGTGVLRWDGRSVPEISNLQVQEAARGHGAGTALIRLAEELVRARGGTQVSIGVGLDNLRAAALYLRLGYTDTGARRTDTYTYFDGTGTEHEATEQSRLLTRDL